MDSAYKSYLCYERNLSPHTVLGYTRDVSAFSEFIAKAFPENTLHSADYPLLRAWIVSLLEEKIAPKSINRKIASLKSYYHFLERKGVIEPAQNPTLKINKLKTAQTLPIYAKASEIVKVFGESFFDPNEKDVVDRLVFCLLYATGMRRGELCSLKLSDIDLSEMKLKVTGKGGKERLLPFPAKVIGLIQAYLPLRNGNNPFLIQTPKGKPAYPNLIYRIVKRYLTQFTATEQNSPHILRHTFATHLLENGAKLNDIKTLLGHANLAATQIYTHNSLAKIKEIYDRAHPKS